MSTEPRPASGGRSSQEARRHPRVPLQLAVRYHPTFVSQWATGRTVNISLGGLCIASEVLPVVGTEMAVEVLRRDEVILKAIGVVRWIRPEPSLDGERRSFGLELTSGEATQTRVGEIIEAQNGGRLETYRFGGALPAVSSESTGATVPMSWFIASVAVALLATAVAVWSLWLRGG